MQESSLSGPDEFLRDALDDRPASEIAAKPAVGPLGVEFKGLFEDNQGADPAKSVLSLEPLPELPNVTLRPHSRLSLVANKKNEGTYKGYSLVMDALFGCAGEERHRFLYREELAALAKKMQCVPDRLIERALREIRESSVEIETDERGKIKKQEGLGKHLRAMLGLIESTSDIYIISSRDQLRHEQNKFSQSMRQRLGKIVNQGEVGVILLAETPPKEAAQEIRKLTDERLGGIMSLWGDRRFRERLSLSPKLKEYLAHETAQAFVSGDSPSSHAEAVAINHALEKKNGFEGQHWLRVLKQVTQGEQHESLKGVLKICLPIVVAVKAAEKFMPGAVHAIGGALDDLFGAVIPNVSQSMGRRDLSFWQRLRSAAGVLAGGLMSVPVSAGLGLAALHLFNSAPTLEMKAVAGALFALACSAGTLATSAVAFWQSWKGLKKLGEDPIFRDLIQGMSGTEKIALAFRNSIMDVPFRIGHTLIGIPAQIGLGIAAGTLGFFHSSLFIAVEGMLETLFGAGTAFLHPKLAKGRRDTKLSKVEV